IDDVGLEHLKALKGKGDGVLITPNHPDVADPAVMFMISRRAGVPFCYMAAYQIFTGNAGLRKFILPRLGVFPVDRADLWPQLFSDVSCIALWISSEKILTRLYSVLHWFHKRLEANVKNPRENRCFQTVIVFSFGSFYNSNKCTVLWKIAARLITVSTSVNKEMWVKLRILGGDP